VPVPAQRDEAAFRTAFSSWLSQRAGADDVELSNVGGPAFSGFSNETILVDATWRSGSERRSDGFAVRLEPSGHQVFPDTAFEPQVRVIRALRENGLPVPEILWYENDATFLGARFFVMRRVPGRAPPDNPPYHVGGWLCDVSPAVRERVWWNGLEAMARVHTTDLQGADLEFLPLVTTAGQLKRDRDYLGWVLRGRSYPLVEKAFDTLEQNVPLDPDPALCWGDSRIGNVLYDDDGSLLAIVDWEMVSIGNPVADLAWFLLLDRHHSETCGVARLEGFPPAGETIGRWEAATGRRAADLSWWLLLGAARYAAILTRVFDLLEDTGLLPGAGAMATENTGTALLKAVFDEMSA
jgi:aminoglycoside phosphotransferase (APT) family kinase protein